MINATAGRHGSKRQAGGAFVRGIVHGQRNAVAPDWEIEITPVADSLVGLHMISCQSQAVDE